MESYAIRTELSFSDQLDYLERPKDEYICGL
jgi:hypothetical protein